MPTVANDQTVFRILAAITVALLVWVPNPGHSAGNGLRAGPLLCPQNGRFLLDPGQLERVVRSRPRIKIADIDGKPVRYVIAGRGDKVVLYFHGTNTGFETTYFGELCLIEAGFRVIMPNRPGYPGTPLSGRESPASCADMAIGVLDEEGVNGKVAVIGRSGGGPCALSFATRYRHRTAALVLQAAVTHSWSDSSFVPIKLRDSYDKAPSGSLNLVRCLQYGFCDAVALAGRRVLRNVTSFKRGFVGTQRMAEANADPAVDAYFRIGLSKIKTMVAKARGSDIEFVNGHRLLPGSKNDGNLFLGDPCCFWSPRSYFIESRLLVPTLILHDPADPIVSFAHAKYVRGVLERNGLGQYDAKLVRLRVAGHIQHLGPDARRMHRTRVSFINRYMR